MSLAGLIMLAAVFIQLTQGRILFQYHQCPVLFEGKCFKVLNSRFLFPKTAGQEACEIAFPDADSHLANIYDKTLFEELVQYLQKLEYNPSIILTGMQYFDKKVLKYNGTPLEDPSWQLPADGQELNGEGGNIYMNVKRYGEGSSLMSTSGNEDSLYNRVLCEYSPK